MNPEFIDRMSWEMAEVYGAITDQILINLAHYFKFYKPGEPLPRTSFEYQANMLAQMGQVNRETVQIIRNNLANADGVLQGVLEQAIIDSVRKAQPELLGGVEKGILSPAGRPVVSPNQTRAFQLYYKQAADKLNLVNTVMLESTQSAYEQAVSGVVSELWVSDAMNRVQIAMDTAAGETLTGVSSWNRALKHATDRMKENGIYGFIDHAGRRWSAEAYTAMDIRTTVANTARAATWETNQTFGNDLYQVSYHNGARPLCYPYQNRVVSSTDAARTVTDLDGNEIEVIAQSATSYGQPAGLFGINCKHFPTPFIPGVSVIIGQPQSPEANEKAYEESQEQRRLERKLREEKKDLMIAKAQGAPKEEIDALREKTRQSSRDIQDFCDRTGRARHKDREAVYTKRSFPAEDRYSVADFEKKQKDMIDRYFSGGGSQQGYTFGQMTPNASTPTKPITPGASSAPAPAPQASAPAPSSPGRTFTPAKTIEEAEAYAQAHFGNRYSQMSYKGIGLEYANECNRVLTEMYDRFDVSPLKSVSAMNMRTKMFRGDTADAAYLWSGDGTLFINPTYYKNQKALTAHLAEIEKLTKTVIDGGQGLLDSGTLREQQRTYIETLMRTGRQCVAQSHDFVQGTFVHESGHMLEDKVFRKLMRKAFDGDSVLIGKSEEFISNSRKKYAGNISAYAISNNREYIAESFTAWWFGETGILDPEIVAFFEGALK